MTMRRAAVPLAMVLVAVIGTTAQATVPTCMTVHAQARWVPYGYDHVVTLDNRCTADATCAVSTDVAPTPQTVAVKAGTSVEVLTFAASPASRFVAKVDCGLVSRRSP
jgi:hypothetical protein